jgi:L-aspartate oxidase
MEVRTEVLVIGAGGAACRAAIAAADSGAQVILVSKQEILKAGATCFPVAEAAAYNAADPALAGDVEKHYSDIMLAAQGMASGELAAILAVGAPSSVRTLENWGLAYDMAGDRHFIYKSCFAHFPRSHVIKGHGEPIVQVMADQIQLRKQIRIIDDLTITGLLLRDGICAGAYGWNKAGEETLIHAGAVVMATGGACQAFERNLNPGDVTGDGYALAWKAGAELVNMEFMQIGMGICHPIVHIFNAYLWPGKPKLLNSLGEEFLGKNLPASLSADDVLRAHSVHFPFSSSDDSKYLEIAVHREVAEGRGAGAGGVQIDLRHMSDSYVNALDNDSGIRRMWPLARDHIKKAGLDLLKETAELCCFAHAINGGIRIDRSSSSSVPGLYAAGETAGGPHGADRLGGNMLVTCQVFGALAGENAAAWAIRNPVHARQSVLPLWREQIGECSELLRKKINADELIAALRATTQKNLLVCRSGKGLARTLETVTELEKILMAAPAGDSIHLRNFELTSMLSSVKLMASAALHRRESRGSHHREDFPAKDENYAFPFVLKNADGNIHINPTRI